MALDDYFSDPSQDCLARLFDAINSMDLSAAPILTRSEKIVMRCSERKDIFAEKFYQTDPHQSGINSNAGAFKPQHRTSNSGESHTSFDDGILLRHREHNAPKDREWEQFQPPQPPPRARERAATDSSHSIISNQQHRQPQSQYSPTDSSFTLGESAVWVDEAGSETISAVSNSRASSAGSTNVGTGRGRKSTDASSGSSHAGTAVATSAYDPQLRPGMAKDTRFFHTSIGYKEHQLPINMPLSTFPEEVGDVRDFYLSQEIYR
jgi:hypothetical protein